MTEHRSIATIAEEIREHWAKPYFGAVPYLEAMKYLNKVTDSYFQDPAPHIIRYFLANATSWRGEHARRIKAELKKMVGA